MTEQPTPPRWAHALLCASLRPRDVDCVSGDLLEEYRDVRRPVLGRRRGNAWYVAQVCGVFLRMVWPFVAATVAMRILTFPLPRGWNPSLVPAPDVSLIDAVILLSAGYYGAHRTGRIITGVIAAGAVSVLGVASFLLYAAITMPQLLAAPFEKPFIFVIVLTLFAIAVAFGVAVGSVGAAAGRWMPSVSSKAGLR